MHLYIKIQVHLKIPLSCIFESCIIQIHTAFLVPVDAVLCFSASHKINTKPLYVIA